MGCLGADVAATTSTGCRRAAAAPTASPSSRTGRRRRTRPSLPVKLLLRRRQKYPPPDTREFHEGRERARRVNAGSSPRRRVTPAIRPAPLASAASATSTPEAPGTASHQTRRRAGLAVDLGARRSRRRRGATAPPRGPARGCIRDDGVVHLQPRALVRPAIARVLQDAHVAPAALGRVLGRKTRHRVAAQRRREFREGRNSRPRRRRSAPDNITASSARIFHHNSRSARPARTSRRRPSGTRRTRAAWPRACDAALLRRTRVLGAVRPRAAGQQTAALAPASDPFRVARRPAHGRLAGVRRPAGRRARAPRRNAARRGTAPTRRRRRGSARARRRPPPPTRRAGAPARCASRGPRRGELVHAPTSRVYRRVTSTHSSRPKANMHASFLPQPLSYMRGRSTAFSQG